MKLCFRFLVSFSLILFQVSALEQSIVPLMERFESVENLSPKKYSTHQWKEITSALNQKEEKIRVVSYNILCDLYDDTLEEENRWPQRAPRVIELLNEMQPDIIGVQELYASQRQDLEGALQESFIFYATPCQDGELNGIFYRKERFEGVEQEVVFMSSTPTVPSFDTLTKVKLKDLVTGKVFAVFNAHLAFSRVNKREYQARFIVRHLNKAAKEGPVIFMGDLNTFSPRLELEKLPFYDGDYIHRILTKGAMKNAREQALLGHLGPLSSFTNASQDGVPFKGTGTPGIFLDHLYITDDVQVLIHAVQPATVDGHFPSDHMPVLIDCRILDAT